MNFFFLRNSPPLIYSRDFPFMIFNYNLYSIASDMYVFKKRIKSCNFINILYCPINKEYCMAYKMVNIYHCIRNHFILLKSRYKITIQPHQSNYRACQLTVYSILWKFTSSVHDDCWCYAEQCLNFSWGLKFDHLRSSKIRSSRSKQYQIIAD